MNAVRFANDGIVPARGEAGADADDESRRSKRSHAMLSATLEVGGDEWPVRLRNVSQVGALVEVPRAVEVGVPVVLKRLYVHVGAIVARRDEKCVGLRFIDPLDPEALEALKLGRAAAGRIAPRPLVAGYLRAAVTGTHHDQTLPPAGLRPSADPLHLRLARELQYAQSLLDQISGPMARDPLLLQRYGRQLQNFDLVTQLLGHLAGVLSTEDRDQAIESIGMVELRGRLAGYANAG